MYIEKQKRKQYLQEILRYIQTHIEEIGSCWLTHFYKNQSCLLSPLVTSPCLLPLLVIFTLPAAVPNLQILNERSDN